MLNKEITIKELSEKKFDWGSIVNIVDQDGLKFKFYSKKKSTGEPTAAYAEYAKGKIVIGTKVMVGYSELDKEFNKNGKNIKYKDRYLNFFDTTWLDAEMDKKVDNQNETNEPDLSDVPF